MLAALLLLPSALGSIINPNITYYKNLTFQRLYPYNFGVDSVNKQFLLTSTYFAGLYRIPIAPGAVSNFAVEAEITVNGSTTAVYIDQARNGVYQATMFPTLDEDPSLKVAVIYGYGLVNKSRTFTSAAIQAPVNGTIFIEDISIYRNSLYATDSSNGVIYTMNPSVSGGAVSQINDPQFKLKGTTGSNVTLGPMVIDPVCDVLLVNNPSTGNLFKIDSSNIVTMVNTTDKFAFVGMQYLAANGTSNVVGAIKYPTDFIKNVFSNDCWKTAQLGYSVPLTDESSISDIGVDPVTNLGYLVTGYTDEFLADNAASRAKFYIYSFSTYLTCEGSDCVKIIYTDPPPPAGRSGALKVCASMMSLVCAWMLLM